MKQGVRVPLGFALADLVAVLVCVSIGWTWTRQTRVYQEAGGFRDLPVVVLTMLTDGGGKERGVGGLHAY